MRREAVQEQLSKKGNWLAGYLFNSRTIYALFSRYILFRIRIQSIDVTIDNFCRWFLRLRFEIKLSVQYSIGVIQIFYYLVRIFFLMVKHIKHEKSLNRKS